MKQIAILGAGFTGLTAAYRLSQKGYQVHLFEKEEKPGGLGRGFKKNNWKWTLEESYHHFFASDKFALNLAEEIGIPIIFKRPITATFTRGKIFPLDSPLALLNYPYLTLFEKLRVGSILAFLKLNPFWKPLEKETAKNWLIKTQGSHAWQELWEPLFISKFGDKNYSEVTASWFWARIKKRSPSLGYPEGGFQNFAEKLLSEIKKRGGKIYLNHEIQEAFYKNNSWYLEIKNLNNFEFCTLNFELIISTLPTPIYLKVFPQLPQEYTKRLSNIRHLDALNLILELKKSFLPSFSSSKICNQSLQYPYWLNINDISFPFLAVVEHTNFMDKKYYGGGYLLYIGNYLPAYHKFFKLKKEALFDLYKPYLLKINPSYNFELYTLNVELFHSSFAQPVVTTSYSLFRPNFKTPLPNLYLGNLDCVYPWDRGVNYAIELGEKLAKIVLI